MWLLSTSRAELHFFTAPNVVDGGYAILSHTWDNHESTFQDLQALKAQCQISNKNPRDLVPPKIRNCCIIAEKHGFRWVWIDTCCIDKTSSSELSEAINSMFRWYAASEVCYAFLAEVPSGSALDATQSAFRRARWHKRGWTLQELIAPADVIFLSRDWQPIGNKLNIASLLDEITGVSAQVLTREVHFSKMSIAARMSWASTRTTTRVEDEAYCLMGLFNVSMPTIYGEGRNAFRRLQEEIMKKSCDTSLFVWGEWASQGLCSPSFPQLETPQESNDATDNNGAYLLASSPKAFSRPSTAPSTATVQFTPNSIAPLQPYLPYQWKPEHSNTKDFENRKENGPFGVIELPNYSITSYGVRCRLPIVDLDDGYALAVLLCNTDTTHIGLLLHVSKSPLQDLTQIKYHVGYGYQNTIGTQGFARVTSLGRDLYSLTFHGKVIQPAWRDIYIADGIPPAHDDGGLGPCYPINCITPAPPFRIPHWLIKRLAALGMDTCSLEMHSKPTAHTPLLASLLIQNTMQGEGLALVLGTCPARGEADGRHAHWAKVKAYHKANWSEVVDLTHDCATHHVADWDGLARRFQEGAGSERTVRLSFARCRISPNTTLVLHLNLEGSEYVGHQHRAKVYIPPLESLAPPLAEAETTWAAVETAYDDLGTKSPGSPVSPEASPVSKFFSSTNLPGRSASILWLRRRSNLQ